jgi:hypothetical protein
MLESLQEHREDSMTTTTCAACGQPVHQGVCGWVHDNLVDTWHCGGTWPVEPVKAAS